MVKQLLHVQNLSIGRGNKVIISEVSFSLSKGKMLRIIGRNGSGKSTLLRVCAGFIPPLSGSLLWEDHSSSPPVIFIDHKDALKHALTVKETITFWAQLYGYPPSRALSTLEVFGLHSFKDMLVQKLSLGQRKRLSLCRLLLIDAPLWLLDEPTIGLDQQGLLIFQKLIDQHLKQQGSIFIASHEAQFNSYPLLNLDSLYEAKRPLLWVA